MNSVALSELAQTLDRHIKVDGLVEPPISSLALYRSSEPTVRDAVVYSPSLCVVVQGAKEVIVDGQAYHYDPAHSLLVSVDMPATSRVVDASVESPCLVAVIQIDSAEVGELLANGSPAQHRGAPTRGLGVTPVEPPLMNAISRLITLLDAPEDIAALSPLVMREITYRLLNGPQGARLRQIAAPGTPSQRIAVAIRWVRDHYSQPIRIDDLADQMGLSQTAFHQHFKAMTGLSPLQYQKRLRLQEARRMMFSEGVEAAEAAFSVGYESPSQFGREYRRLFGASPRQDISSLTSAASI
ncbi:AraC family transcriptional regulator [Aeoliella mucimassa]|uniref:HTH-type transcriptional activator RhaS n=1 Tax=Aeoliella mucimassa TaxID=2527972 RepID=A0A518APG0_9BACT|nr:AraC family transcriptional regulator [Aeoliella mucimassa]QDU56617.1 HTH-type transcriptional activator RhaS [Aeoliella mucimassa]